MHGTSLVAAWQLQHVVSARRILLLPPLAAVETPLTITPDLNVLPLPRGSSPQRTGLTQARSDIAVTKTRIAESEKRISTLAPSVDKAYWTEARNELRRQVGFRGIGGYVRVGC